MYTCKILPAYIVSPYKTAVFLVRTELDIDRLFIPTGYVWEVFMLSFVLCFCYAWVTEFSYLGEVRNLNPECVNVIYIALTATARSDVCKLLGVKDPYVVTVSLDKSNVILGVAVCRRSLETTF